MPGAPKARKTAAARKCRHYLRDFRLRESLAWAAYMRRPPFLHSIRAKLLLIALLLLLIPFIGFRFIQEMDAYLRAGQEQVLVSAAKLLSASLSDRPQLFRDSGEAGSEELERRRLLALFSSADPEAASTLGIAYVPSGEVERILNVIAGTAARIWVVDAHSQVKGLAGSLSGQSPASKELATPGFLAGLYARIVRPIARLAEVDPYASNHPVKEDATLAQRTVMSQVERALVGEPNARWRHASVGGGIILSVAQPVWQGDSIVGAVVVEETTRSSQSIKFAALESLLVMTAIVLLAGFVALLGFAWRLTLRMRRLQAEADASIDAHGRVSGRISLPAQDDEIGSLARTVDATLQRLSRYNNYLEQMAARLSHELRTPVAVVRSSLDNLKQSGLQELDRVYVERAEEGVARLANLISRMAEATQLESMMQEAEMRHFDLAKVVRGCVEGYRLAFASTPPDRFQLRMDVEQACMLRGIPDAIAQLLDKLVQNATDFATPGTPIVISLRTSHRQVVISVENTGPPLPPGLAGQLFVSMVSARTPSASKEGHLGLGLYIVRLVAEFHGGSVDARNSRAGDGVQFKVILPLSGLPA